MNGKRLFVHHLPEHDESHMPWNTWASAEVGGVEEKLYHAVEIDPAHLAKRNVLAVQVHQCNGKSSDLSFDLRVMALGIGSE